MLAYPTQAINDLVKIDANHANLVRALVMCAKPARILELGFGSGESTRFILAGLNYNEKPFEYVLADNWMDFGGVQPQLTRTPEFSAIKFVTSDEEEFVKGDHGTFDFIMSDADHFRTQLWFEHVYQNLLNRGGILIYHDVTNPQFPNLLRVYTDCIRNGYDHAMFNGSSRREERCGRGLLAIFKH